MEATDNFLLCVCFYSVHSRNNFICHQNLHFWRVKYCNCPVIKVMFSPENKVYASQMKKESQAVSAQTRAETWTCFITWKVIYYLCKKPIFIARCYLSLITCRTYILIRMHSAPWIYESCRPNSRIQREESQNCFFQNCSAHKDTKLCLALLPILEFPPKYHWKEMVCFLRAGRIPWEGHPARVISVQLSMTTARQSLLAVIMGWNYFHKHKNFHWNISAHKGLYPESCIAPR